MEKKWVKKGGPMKYFQGEFIQTNLTSGKKS